MAIIISGITRLSRLPSQQGERMEKVFIADDKFVDVISILERRGWTRSRHANSPNFLLKWRNLSNINFRMLRKDQFVNHVFNSQQLSNKALLADHLAFQHDRRGKQRLDGSGTEPCAGLFFLAPGCERTKGRNKLEKNTHEGSTMNPDAFFPRCFNMQDGALSGLIEAFIVSAAAALLRRIIQGKDVPYQDANPGNTNRLDAPTAAAISVVSRYVTHKNQYESPSQDTTGQSSARRAQTSASAQSLTPWDDPLQHGSVQRAHGVGHAPIVPLSIEDPACFIVLAAWEAVAAEPPTTDEIKAVDKHSTMGNAEGTRDTEKCFCFRRAHGGSLLEEAFLYRETSAREARTPSSLIGSHGAASKLTVNNNSYDGRALRCLQALEAADPQAAVMGEANVWIVKPAGLSCGRGVHATSSLWKLLTACRQLGWKAVVQKYVEQPLLVQGYKFDLRQWVLVTSCNPLMVWGFGECYVRFASKPFTTNPSSLSDRFVHLCNHSVQRDNASDRGSIDDSTQGLGSRPSGSRGHMWTADQFQEHLQDHFEYDAFRDVVLPRIRSVVVETLITVRESLEMKGKALEWLGFDLMLTEHLQVMLLEVNVSPDVSHSTPVTARLVPAATEDALALLLDDGVAAARAASPLLTVNRHDASRRRMATEDRGSSLESSIEKPTTDSDAWTGNVDACERETEPRTEGVPRWHLWYRGKEESTTALGSRRDAKRSFFEARRKQRRQEDHRRMVEPRNECTGGSLSIVNDIVELMTARSKIRQDNHAVGTTDYR